MRVGDQCPNAGLALAIDRRGGGVLLANGYRLRQLVNVSYRRPGGRFTRAAAIQGESRANFGRIGMSRDGRAVSIWSSIRAHGPIAPGIAGVAGALKPIRGRFRDPFEVSDQYAGGAHGLAVNESGASIAVWRSERSYQLEAAYKPPKEAFGAPEVLSAPLNPDFSAVPIPAMSPAGKATVAWLDTSDGQNWGVFIATQP